MAARWRDVHTDLTERALERQKACEKFLNKIGGNADWGSLARGNPHGVTIPVPESDGFDYPPNDAELLAATIAQVVENPVVLTGGGWGGNADLVILLGVRVIPHFPGKGEWVGSRFYKEDMSQAPTAATVEVDLHRPAGETAGRGEARREVFSPHIASWRLDAIRGFGAEAIETNWPTYSAGDRDTAYANRHKLYEEERRSKDRAALISE